jgi:hypothetical protein
MILWKMNFIARALNVSLINQINNIVIFYIFDELVVFIIAQTPPVRASLE